MWLTEPILLIKYIYTYTHNAFYHGGKIIVIVIISFSYLYLNVFLQ